VDHGRLLVWDNGITENYNVSDLTDVLFHYINVKTCRIKTRYRCFYYEIIFIFIYRLWGNVGQIETSVVYSILGILLASTFGE
jgi:hypothetical protein